MGVQDCVIGDTMPPPEFLYPTGLYELSTATSVRIRQPYGLGPTGILYSPADLLRSIFVYRTRIWRAPQVLVAVQFVDCPNGFIHIPIVVKFDLARNSH